MSKRNVGYKKIVNEKLYTFRMQCHFNVVFPQFFLNYLGVFFIDLFSMLFRVLRVIFVIFCVISRVNSIGYVLVLFRYVISVYYLLYYFDVFQMWFRCVIPLLFSCFLFRHVISCIILMCYFEVILQCCKWMC